jgi:glycosyltransferase involved in cell wall biosynthesis
MKEINFLASLSGRGGGEQSSIAIVNALISKGWKVYLIPWGAVHKSYLKHPCLQPFSFENGMEDNMKTGIPLFFYGNDQVYKFNNEELTLKIIEKSSKIVIGINFIIGGLSRSTWIAKTKKVKGVLFLNDEKRKSWEQNYKKYYDYKITLDFLPPCIDINKFKDIPIQTRKEKDPFVVLRHSRGDNRKFVVKENIGKGENVFPWQKYSEQEIDIEFYKKLLEKVPNIHFKFMSGNKVLIDEFEKNERFTFYKWDQISVPEFLSLGHTYLYRVAKTLRDQGPRCICEAMASGLPCISEPRDGPRDRIKHGYNGFYAIETIDYISKLKLMEKNDEMRISMGYNAKENAINKFIPSQWVNKIEEFLECKNPDTVKCKNPDTVLKANNNLLDIKANNKYKYINKMKNTASSITLREYAYLCEIISINKIKNILEFGPGFSTYAFMENQCNIYSYEHKQHWLDINKKQLKGFSNIHFYPFKYEENIQLEGLDRVDIDFAFVDSPQGTRNDSRLHTCIFASKVSDVFILHDCRRWPEKDTMKKFEEQGWNYTFIESKRGIGICYKNNFVIPEYNIEKLDYLLNS